MEWINVKDRLPEIAQDAPFYNMSIRVIAAWGNDGLTEQELYWWFKELKKPFIGQIICWNENIEY